MKGWRPEKVGLQMVVPLRCGAPKVCGAPLKRWGPKGGAQRVGGPKIRAFFPSPASIFVLFLSFSGVFSWNVGGCFGVLGLSCETPAAANSA